MRLRRSDPASPGHGRHRRGRGFAYHDWAGGPLTQAEVVRCQELVIPPAWADVWICADPMGHIQATGVDAAGRRQYLYHPQWRVRRDRRKFEHVLEVGAHLPLLRRRIGVDLRRDGVSREKVLALAARLIDDGLFRVGSDEYAAGDDPTFGVATLLAGHVSLTRPPAVTARFRYLAKGRIERTFAVTGRPTVTAIAALKRIRRRDERLLAYPTDDGVWRDVHAADINGYLRHSSGLDMTAKDLRTWHGTLHAAAALAVVERGRSAASARRAVASVMREVAHDLGNTPAVARASYVDPRVVDAFLDGRTLDPDVCRRGCGPATERAMLRLLVDG
jgi:DNA topoisomerase IB